MNKLHIENQKEIKDVANVLADLEQGGLKQACVASGYTRGWLTDTKPSDIDIAYVGDIHFEQAQELLRNSISRRGLEDLDWDLNGIWNAELAYPEITITERHYLIHYVCSIDTVYLASDGKLYDPTG